MKKIITLLLAGIMTASICGCSKNEAGDGGIPTITWYVPGETQSDQATVMEVVNKLLSEKAGAKIDMKYVSDGSFEEKMRMIMAAREKFDLCFTGYNNKYTTAVENGALYDITKLLEKTNIRETVGDTILDIARVDGKIYGVPNQQIFALPQCLVVRKELADKYKLDMSNFTKTTDIEPFLEIIKQKEPDYIPFSAYHKLNSFWSIDEDRYYDIKGINIDEAEENNWEAIDPQKTLETRHERAKIMSDWYKKGYIRKDVDTVQNEVAEMAAGKYAVTISAYKPGVESELKTQLNGDVVIKVIGPTVYTIDFPLSTMISVSATTKHPEKCVKVIEVLNSDTEIYNTLCYGVEGKHYKKLSENRIEIIPDSGYEPNACWKFGNNFNAWLTPEQPDDCHEQSKKINESAKIIGIPGFVFNDENVKMELTQIKTVDSKYMGIYLGSADLDSVWDTYVSEYEKAGIRKVYEEVEKQINEFEKTIK